MSNHLSGSEIRQRFLDFFAARNHKILPSASLVPEDPTVLLTIAGMLPFKPIFLGQKTPEFPRATTSQKCIRTNDIENVGRTARHHTFFEMLGNFSFGDYFKEQAIAWAWELSTEVFNLPPERLVVSVFREDEEAFAIWRDKIGIPAHRIQKMGEADNFWVSGPTGPCGPCSEIYYDFHPELGDKTIDLEDDSRFIEFYNLVFMQYNRDADGNLTPLANKNIDTGMGLERMAQILQKVANNYETDLIFPIVAEAARLAAIDYQKADEKTKVSLKVIGDHVRSVVHMIADGISASNTDRGYVLRRLIRRVVRHGRLIGIEGQFITKVAEVAIALSESVYGNVRERETVIKAELEREEARFLETLERGEKLLESILEKEKSQISGVDAFTLYDTYGFPLELTQEIAEEQGLSVDTAGFEQEMKKQQQRSKAAHETIDLTVQGSLDKLAEHIHPTEFLGYTDLQATATVTAVLVAGKTVESAAAGTEVQVVLDQTPFYAESGGQIGDKGYLTGDNLLIRVEDVQKKGAIAMFGEKYGSEVRVIDIPSVSMELCGGTHVKNTAEIGLFKIISETGIAAGIRRIEAVAGPAVLAYLNERDQVVRDLCDRFKVKPLEIPDRITALQSELKGTQKQLEAVKQELALNKSDALLSQTESIGEFKLLVASLGDIDANALMAAAERLQQKLGEGAVVLASTPAADKVSLVAAFSPRVIKDKGLQAGKFIGAIAKICAGGGGGRPNLAQAGGRDASKLSEALAKAKSQLTSSLQ